jgi:hypothetical protein
VFERQRAYLKDNPKGYWFKRKLYGWGWVPVRWQGWAVVGAWLGAVLLLSRTLDEASPPREVMFTFVLPVAFLTLLLIRICYRKGEKPRWQWGPPDEKEE